MPRFFIALILILLTNSLLADKLFIIGNRVSFSTTMSLKQIKTIYLMQKKKMANGKNILPINLPSADSIRNVFSQAIFNKDAVSLADYWNRIAFRGIKPPLIQSSQKSVELFVSRVRGAIGYISVAPVRDQVMILAEINFSKDKIPSVLKQDSP